MDCIICRYGELALKGRNRHLFEERLLNNIRYLLDKQSIEAKLKKIRGRVFIFTDDEQLLNPLARIFGLVSISPATIADANIESIKSAALEYSEQVVNNENPKTFRISSRRGDKDFELSSGDLDIMLGSLIGEKFNLKAKMKGADFDLGVEVHDKVFLFHEFIYCPGGLPLGISGKVVARLKKEEDLLAAWFMMRRGCSIIPLIKDSDFDFTLLEKYHIGAKLKPITDLENFKDFPIVTGETLDSLDENEFKEQFTLQPLIAWTKEEIKEKIESLR